MIDTPRIAAARAFARAAHDSVGHKRKYTGDPYWMHTERVASIVAEHGGSEDMIIAALFHDTLEDVTPRNPEIHIGVIRRLFGDAVAGMVIDLTDVYTKEQFPALNRRTRKDKEATRLSRIGADSATIKYADFIDNGVDIEQNDPSFARVYCREKAEVLAQMLQGDRTLHSMAASITLRGLSYQPTGGKHEAIEIIEASAEASRENQSDGEFDRDEDPALHSDQ
jgi:(p)ppGpp synthase/HD superfamily hydrolase